jgi:hypothetical protein
MEKEITISMIIVAGVIGMSLGFVIPAITAQNPPFEVVHREDPGINNSYINYTKVTLLVSESGNICENCHLSGKKFIPQAFVIKGHVEGGAYCLKCHRITHENHPVDENITCSGCHSSKTPKIPSPANGKIECNNCHAFPDAFAPSGGNLVRIHRPRGIDCISCHIDCTKCHDQMPANSMWDKRQAHFSTLLRAHD